MDDVLLGEPLFAPFEVSARLVRRPGRCGTLAPSVELEPWLNSVDRNLRVGRSFGNVVYILLFSSSCPNCFNDGLPALCEIYDRLAHCADRILYRAVHSPLDPEVDDLEAGLEAIEELGLEIPVAYDIHRQVAREFSAPSLPWTIVIDPCGTVRFRGYAPDPARLAPEIEAMLERHRDRFGDRPVPTHG